jgi:hypothetical protein
MNKKINNMLLSLSENANVNYVCTVFQFKEYMRHPHGNADKLEIVTYQGCPVIVQKELYKDGDWLILFPTETHISKSFLSEHNAFRHTELNKDPQHAAGFFEDNCRVKAISLRGVTSRGYIVPVSHLNLTPDDLVDGLNFDTVNGKLLVKKYIIPVQALRSETRGAGYSRRKNELARIVEGQFEFHYDTEMLAKNLDMLNPDDVITLTHKWHGTSLIGGKLLCHRKLSIFEKLKRLFGAKVNLTEYRLITSSRKRILTLQDKDENERIHDNGSTSDKLYLCASKILEPYIEDGMTVYSEIVGYFPSGKEIQKGYDYKCENGTFKIMPYRVTKLDTGGSGGANGKWSEYASQQVNDYAAAAGKMQAAVIEEDKNAVGVIVPTIIAYKGVAKNMYPDLQTSDIEQWRNEFLTRLSNDKNFYMNENSPDCNNPVPHEGLVLNFENRPNKHALKIKCDKFYEYESKMLDTLNETLE